MDYARSDGGSPERIARRRGEIPPRWNCPTHVSDCGSRSQAASLVLPSLTMQIDLIARSCSLLPAVGPLARITPVTPSAIAIAMSSRVAAFQPSPPMCRWVQAQSIRFGRVGSYLRVAVLMRVRATDSKPQDCFASEVRGPEHHGHQHGSSLPFGHTMNQWCPRTGLRTPSDDRTRVDHACASPRRIGWARRRPWRHCFAKGAHR